MTPTAPHLTNERDAIRKTALSRRDALDESMRHALSERVSDNLRGVLKTLRAEFIHCYISFRSEVQTREFIEESLQEGARVVVPVVENLDGNSILLHAEIAGLSNLRQGTFGLEQPIEREEADLTGLDAVILPLSAFDAEGNRLGYGKGFYDRFLKEISRDVMRIGLAFDCQYVPTIPALSHDERLDFVVTESHVHDYRKTS